MVKSHIAVEINAENYDKDFCLAPRALNWLSNQKMRWWSSRGVVYIERTDKVEEDEKRVLEFKLTFG